MHCEGEPVGYLLKRIHDHVDRQANNSLKPCGMTFSQMRLMSYLLKRAQTPPSQKEIEEHFQVSHPTVVGLIQRLEAKGLVRCAFDSADKRVKSVYLTAQGRGVVSRANEHRALMERRITAGMSPSEVEQLRALLKKVLRNVSQE